MLAGVVAAAGAASAAEPGWTDRLAAVAPALRACLGADPAAFATDAVAEADGAVRVRVWRGGAAWDCRAPGAVGAVEWRPMPDAGPPDPAATALFLERRCVDARRVDGPDGAVLGWIAYPGC